MSDAENQDSHQPPWDFSNRGELYRILFEEDTDALFITDPRGRFIAVNPRAIELTGYSREELLGLDISDMIPPEDLAWDPVRLDDLRQGKIVLKERQIRRKDGSLLSVEVTARMLPEDNLLGIVRDITALKQAEGLSDRRARELAALQALGLAVSASLSLELISAAALRGMQEAVEPDLAFLFLREGERLIPQGVQPPEARQRLGSTPEHQVGECLCGLAVREGRPLYSRDIHTDRRCTWKECKLAGLRSFAALPLRSGEEIIGVIGLASLAERNFEAQAGFLETLTHEVSVALANARLYEAARLEVTERRRAEKKLRASEERYRRLADNAPDAIYHLSLPDGTYRYISPAATTIFGYSPDEFYANPQLVEKIFHPDWIPYFREQWGRLLQGDVPPTYEFQIIHKNGDIRWVNQRNVLITGDDGRPAALEGVVTDVTAQKRSELALRESEEKYRRLIETTDTGYVIIDEQGRVTDANQEYAHLTGRQEVEEVIGHSVLEWTAMHDLERNAAEVRKCVEQGFVRHLEVDYLTPAGRVIPVEINATVLGAPGTLRILCLCRDITGRKQAEEALRTKTEDLDRFFTVALDLLCIADTEGYFRRLNPQWQAVLGYPVKDLEGRRFLDFVHPEDLEDTRIALGLLAEQKAVVDFTNRYRCRDGSYRWIEWRSYPAGRRIYAAARDITERKRAEETIRRNEELLRSLIDSAPFGAHLYELDEDDRLVFSGYNRSANRILGVDNEQFLGQTIEEAFPPLAETEIPAQYKRVAATGQGFETEQVDFDHGEIRGAFEVHGFQTAPRKMAAFFVDITERKRAETRLFRSEERLRLALQAANQGLYDLNVQTGETQVSPEYATMLGYDPAEFHETNAAWIERLHPEDREPVAAIYRDYIAGKVPEYRVEFRQRTQSGDWKWILSLGKIVERDARGEPRRMLGTHTDITERKRAEEALRESEARYRALFEANPHPMWVYDLESLAFLAVNDAAVIHYGFSRDEFLAMTIADIRPPEDVPLLLEYVAQVGERVFNKTDTWRHRTKDGTTIQVEVTSHILDYGGHRARLVLANDITERRQAEAEKEKLQAQLLQAQKMESVARLAGGVAHDFNNMLTAILGHAELGMMRCTPAEPIHADLEAIEKSAHRAADLTRQLLAFARKQTVAPKVLDLNDTVAGMLKMMLRLIGEDIDLVWMPGAGLWSVRIDPSQIDQLLANLCVNARDAIAGVGKITIETENVVFDEAYCAVHPASACGEYVLLAVSDDGCGMNPDILEHLFEPFFTTKEVGKGTGLGLATVYGIVKQNEGFINVYSEPGSGSTFKIYLPRFAGEVTELLAASAVKIPKGRGETVLLVEDEAVILNVGRAMLERLGYTVLTAGTPGDALRQAKAHAAVIQLLITDVVMPEMNGRDLAELIRDTIPGLKCLFTSGYTADVIAHRGMLDDGVHFLQKPFSLKDLAPKVRQALERD